MILKAPERSKSARSLYNQYKKSLKELKKDHWDLKNAQICVDCGLDKQRADSDLELFEEIWAAKQPN